MGFFIMFHNKQERIKQRFVEKAVSAWRADIIEKLKTIGVIYCKSPKNKTLIKDCYDNSIDFPPIPRIEDFYSNSQCTTKEYYNGIVVQYRKTKEKKLIKPEGYNQNSKKSENVNIENFYETWAWKDIRYQAIKKHGRRCMNCVQSPNKENKVVLHVDHIKPVRKYPELALNIDNLQVLCNDCNQGKGYWDETDFR